MSNNMIAQDKLRKYTTLSQLTAALERSRRDMLVVLGPGNETASLWPLGHPCGWSEDSPRVFRAPAGMNGQTAEFLRKELNERNGWAITGDTKICPDEWFDFAVQAELILEPNEGLHHQVWTQLRRFGECTSASLSDLTGRDKQQCRRALSRMGKKGYVDRYMIDDRTALWRATDKEPPFEAKPNQNDKENSANLYREMQMLMDLLEKGPMTSSGLSDMTDLPRSRVSALLHRMKSIGAVDCERVGNQHYWEART